MLAVSRPWSGNDASLCEGAADDVRNEDCLTAGKWGKRWTNPSCEKLFGPPDPPGALVESQALEQRPDGSTLGSTSGLRRCDGIELGVALAGDRYLNQSALVALVEERLSPAQAA